MKNKLFSKIMSFIQRHPWISLGITLFGLFIIMFLVIMMNSLVVTEIASPTTTQTKTTPSPTVILVQKPFIVIGTSPKDGATNVNTGEITISATTDTEVVSKNSFSLDISPKLPYYWKDQSTYPTKQVQMLVYGGLAKETTYTVTMKDPKGNVIKTWSFTTSNEDPISTSALYRAEAEKQQKTNYPLFDYVPYTTNSYSVDYIDKRKLRATILDPRASQEEVKNDIDYWMRTKKVDPATHTIEFVPGYVDY